MIMQPVVPESFALGGKRDADDSRLVVRPKRRTGLGAIVMLAPLQAFAQPAAASATHDGFFLIAAILAIVGGAVRIKIDEDRGFADTPLGKRVLNVAGVVALAGALGLYATHGNTWTVKGLAQAVGFYKDEALAARPFFDEGAANAAIAERGRIASERARIDETLEALSGQIFQVQQQEERLVHALTSAESDQHARERRRELLISQNLGLRICIEAGSNSLDAISGSDDDQRGAGETIVHGAAAVVCASMYAHSAETRDHVHRVIAELALLDSGNRNGIAEITRLRSELTSVRQNAAQTSDQITSLQHQRSALASLNP